ESSSRRQIHLITMHSRGAALRLLGRREAFRGSGFRRQPCEPNRVAAAPLGLKVLGFVNAGTLSETNATINNKSKGDLTTVNVQSVIYDLHERNIIDRNNMKVNRMSGTTEGLVFLLTNNQNSYVLKIDNNDQVRLIDSFLKTYNDIDLFPS